MSGAEAVEPGPVHEVGQHMRLLNDFMLGYKFAIDSVVTKIQILREDYNNAHDHNPIEHINSRLKSPESILAKARRKGQPVDLDSIRANTLDIAGVRVTCCFLSDTYAVRDVIARHEDVRVLEERDYIAAPKANGYQSLHLIVEVPVYRAREVSRVPVEIQLRTIAMDFWASLEHRIYYKYGGSVPASLVEDLTQAAAAVNSLDLTMQDLHQQVHAPQSLAPAAPLAPPADLFARYARALGVAVDDEGPGTGPVDPPAGPRD
ncbi:GTP pyrophosphokinase [Auraticoccus monumenti]|uniref:Putative GTP pyrophosphokinase n=1 Tax=Auraticoccus monumenti TaxID=675864 RepID=A0A1G6X3C4_9ACTN|nr:GTP pyrophosphokinase family protein [Auraticoccus monumenti]SDD72544.1 putative GTP pyrophosphokinase [Auraticoccus monumenti]